MQKDSNTGDISTRDFLVTLNSSTIEYTGQKITFQVTSNNGELSLVEYDANIFEQDKTDRKRRTFVHVKTNIKCFNFMV